VAEVSDELAHEVGVQFQATAQKDADGEHPASGVIGGTNFPAQRPRQHPRRVVSPLSRRHGLNIGYVTGTIKLRARQACSDRRAGARAQDRRQNNSCRRRRW
jgi:hypothetical protein